MEYLNQVLQEAEALEEIYSFAQSEGGKKLIESQYNKVKASLEVLIDPKIKFKDKEDALNVLMANLQLLKELSGATDSIKMLEKSLDIEYPEI